jgi:hypothetical protein
MRKNIELKEVIERSLKLRELYHELELKHHGSEWTVEEDALAFLTDAGLVGRLTNKADGPRAGNLIRSWPINLENVFGGWPCLLGVWI